MSTYLYACGFNGFSKLTSIKLINEDGVTKGQPDDGDVFKLLLPFLLMQLSESYHLHNIATTWSRTGITFKRNDNSFFSVITKFFKKNSTTLNELQVLENQLVVAATDKDILLKNHELTTQYCVLKDKSSSIERIQLDCQLEISTIKGAYENYFVAFDTNFGTLTNTDKSSWEKDVENVKEEHLKFYCIASGLVVREISCGKEHAILLDANGCIFSYGGGSKGQLGHNTVESKSLPTLIDALLGLPIQSISAGGWHSAAVSDIGDLYMWGWNESGQLGILSAGSIVHDGNSSKIVAEPHCVDFSSEVNVLFVSCGSRHTVILTDNGEVFASGWNKYGQLGLGDTTNRCIFSKLDTINNLIYKKVFAGQWNTYFLCEHV